MNHPQGTPFLFYCKKCRMIGSTQWFVFPAGHLFLHDPSHLLSSRLWQPNRLFLPQLIRDCPYHIVRIVPLTEGTPFQVHKGYHMLISKKDVD